MTGEEKQVVKDMNKLIFEMIVQKTALMAILQKYVPTWPLVLASLISSQAHQTLLKENEKLRQSIDSLIEQNNLTSLRSSIANIGQSN